MLNRNLNSKGTFKFNVLLFYIEMVNYFMMFNFLNPKAYSVFTNNLLSDLHINDHLKCIKALGIQQPTK